ncbi:MAG: hypothetical protein KC502_04685 [Myxococcales bacterium]|nr:hypothetical protein [Myxococcales bacterium]
MTENGFRYAGWFLLDVRLTGAAVIFSVALAVLILALWFRGRRWDEYVVGFLAVLGLSLLGTLLLTNGFAHYPALQVESIFPIP